MLWISVSSWERTQMQHFLSCCLKNSKWNLGKGNLFMNSLQILTQWTRGRGVVWLKWWKLLIVKLQRAAVALDQLLAPGDLSPLGCRPLNAEIRWDVFNVKSSTIRYYFPDRYIPLDLRELSLFCLSETSMSKFSCRLKLKRPFPYDLMRLQSSL